METPNPTNPNIEFSKEEIRELGIKARQMEDGLLGNCYEIAHNLGNLLVDHGLPYKSETFSVEQVWVGGADGPNHYILVLDGEFFESASESERVYIDTSLDQFCDENVETTDLDITLGPKEELKRVYIYISGDSRLDKYKSVRTFLD